MPVNLSQREFWTQKNPAEEFNTVTFDHPHFSEPIRLVLNKHEPKTLGGKVFKPVAGELNLPAQGSELIPKLDLRFSRVQIGDEFKQVINDMSPFDWQEKSVSVTFESYNSLSTDKPMHRYRLYTPESGIKFNRTTVQISATDDNPMILAVPRNGINPVYTVEEYPGLKKS